MFFVNVPRFLAELPGAAWRRLSGPRALTILKHREALGDLLMLTPLVRTLKKTRPQLPIVIASRHPYLFDGNPYIDENRGWHLFKTHTTATLNYNLETPRHPHYVEELWILLWEHLLRCGLIEGERPPLDGRHPELFLTDAERARGRELAGAGTRPVVALISGGKLKPTHNREWGHGNYVRLAETLAPHAELLQISGDEDLHIGTANRPLRRVRTSLREVAAVLAACDAFLTQEGGLMHVARAVGTPTVVIYGGTLLPEHSGYDRMTNLANKTECSPCRHMRANCAHLKCMVPITPRRVLREIGALLAQRGHVLPKETYAQAPDTWTPPPFVDKEILARELAGGASTSFPTRPSV